jgi:hypothetical protein
VYPLYPFGATNFRGVHLLKPAVILFLRNWGLRNISVLSSSSLNRVFLASPIPGCYASFL